MRRVAALGLVLALVAFAVPAGAELTREELSQAKALISTSDAAKQIEGVRILGRGNDKTCVDLLLKLLATSSLASNVHDAVVEALGRTTDEDAIDHMVKMAAKGEWQFRADVIAALVETGSEKAETALVKAAESKSDPLVQTVAIDALGDMKSEKGIAPIAAALTARSTPWQVKIAAIQALAKIHKNACVDPLIEALEDASEGRIKEEVEQALHSLTGKQMPTPAVWKSWWSMNNSRPLEGPGFDPARRPDSNRQNANAGGGGAGGSAVEPTYYGEKIRSKRLVFVIDVSGSMLTELGRAPNIPQQAVSGGAPGQQAPKGPDYSKARSKMDLAKIELVHAIQTLPADASFSIVWYSTDVLSWKDGLVPATPANKADAIKKVESLTADGLTNIYGGLEKAFSLHSGQGMGNVVSGADYSQGADTIYFMTDGWPTCGEALGGIAPQNGGGNVAGYRDELLKVVAEWVKIRKVKINTVGISEQPGGYDETLLRGLADMSGGSFVAP